MQGRDVSRGIQLLNKREKNPLKSSAKLAEEDFFNRSLCLTITGQVNLAPDTVEGVMEEPPTFDFSIRDLFSRRLPEDWGEQRKSLCCGRIICEVREEEDNGPNDGGFRGIFL